MKKLLERFCALVIEFFSFAAPKIGWTMITLMLLLSAVSSVVSIAAKIMGVCTP